MNVRHQTDFSPSRVNVQDVITHVLIMFLTNKIVLVTPSLTLIADSVLLLRLLPAVRNWLCSKIM